MATEHCPDCGESIRPRAKSCPCGWRATAKVDPIAADRNRCAFAVDGRRCRNLGTIGDNLRGGGPLFCRWHSLAPKPAEAMPALEESERQVPESFDYSTAAIVKRTKDAYVKRPVWS